MASRKQQQLLEVESERSDVIRVPLDSLHPDPANLRGPVDPSDPEIVDLAGSISSCGLVSPLTVRLRPEGGYFLVAGHRRAAACRLAGLEYVHAVLRTLNDFQVTEIMLSENGLRERLEPRQEAEGYRILLASGKYTVQGLSERLKIRPQRIWERLHFLEDGPEMTEAVTSGRLPASVADVVRATAKSLYTTPSTLLESMSEDIPGDWTARQVREWCKKRKAALEAADEERAKKQAEADAARIERNKAWNDQEQARYSKVSARRDDVLARMRALSPDGFWRVIRDTFEAHLQTGVEVEWAGEVELLLDTVTAHAWDALTSDDPTAVAERERFDAILSRVEGGVS